MADFFILDRKYIAYAPCKVYPGMFSHEYAVHVIDSYGKVHESLVSAGAVTAEEKVTKAGVSGLVAVTVTGKDSEENALICSAGESWHNAGNIRIPFGRLQFKKQASER